MKKANKRPDLIEIIIRKTGIPRDESGTGYFSKRQLKALIVYIETNESKLASLTKEVRTLTESITSVYGKDKPRSRKPEDI